MPNRKEGIWPPDFNSLGKCMLRIPEPAWTSHGTQLAILLEKPRKTFDFRRYMHSGGRDKLSRISVSRYLPNVTLFKKGNTNEGFELSDNGW